MAFYGKDKLNISTVCCWVRESRVSARNLDMNDQLWYNLNRQKVKKLFQGK